MKHLARLWRPQQFGAVVGQDLAVRLLKNSLYRDTIFPVYLFSGQRGTGKTTLARLFAGAINCEKRAAFRESPHGVELPCRTCGSCLAMAQGTHTDFIEIDAASHTGVDNVRSILEAALFSPQMGSRRIYLIDEAHMLSKAACNALLKTLEEPIDTVLFLMATTELYKIPDTVRSRCFQVFLSPHALADMVLYMEGLCQRERIAYERSALERIAQASDGSLRDALNTCERALIAYDRLVEADLHLLLGTLTLVDIFSLIRCIVQRDAVAALALVRTESYRIRGVPGVWSMVYEALRLLMLCQYRSLPPEAQSYSALVQTSAELVTVAQVQQMMRLLYERELQMVRSSNQQLLLELFVVQAIGIVAGDLGSQADTVVRTSPPVQAGAGSMRPPVVSMQREAAREQVVDKQHEQSSLWQRSVVVCSGEPLYASIAQQGVVVSAPAGGMMTVAFPAPCRMLEQAVETVRLRVEAEMRRLAGNENIRLVVTFLDEAVAPSVSAQRKEVPQRSRTLPQGGVYSDSNKAMRGAREQSKQESHQPVDPLTRTVLELFPGTIVRSGSGADE